MSILRIVILPEAEEFLRRQDSRALTVESFVVAGCCVPDLPPVVRPGPPRHADGFRRVGAGGWTVYVDELLGEPDELAIGMRRHRSGGGELAVVGWRAPDEGAARAEEGERT